MNITIRKIDEAAFRRFKAKAAEEGMKLGEALTQAIELWINYGDKRKRTSLLEIKPLDWGPGTEKASVEVDKTLYGEGA